MTLEEGREAIGRTVIYQPGNGQPDDRGVITSVGHHFIFVRYGGEEGRGQATPPESLTLEAAR